MTVCAGSGRPRVRRMISSMSRSRYMLIALAEPAATVPPSERGQHQTGRRDPLCGKDHRGNRRDQEQDDDPGFVSRTYGDDRVAEGAARRPQAYRRSGRTAPRCRPACTASRRDTVASATSVAQISTDSATWSTTAHGRRRDQTFSAPDDDLRRRTGRARAWRARPGPSSGPPWFARGSRPTAPAGRRRAARTRCRNIAVAAPPRAGTRRPFINGQSVNASPADSRANVRADQQQRTGGAGGDQREPRERTVAARSSDPSAPGVSRRRTSWWPRR